MTANRRGLTTSALQWSTRRCSTCAVPMKCSFELQRVTRNIPSAQLRITSTAATPRRDTDRGTLPCEQDGRTHSSELWLWGSAGFCGGDGVDCTLTRANEARSDHISVSLGFPRRKRGLIQALLPARLMPNPSKFGEAISSLRCVHRHVKDRSSAHGQVKRP